MADSPLIDVSSVSFAWVEGEPALRECSLRVERGEALGLLGRNGAGKTTLLRLLVGQIRAHGGHLAVFGLDPVRDGIPVRRRIGFVPEANELPGHLRATGVLDLHRSLFPSWDRELEARLLRRFDLPERARVSGLSKGQARQLALTCALAHRPELLLLDEPASGLDPAMRREFLEATLEFLDGATTVLFSSHHVQDVERLASRVIVIEQGSVHFDAAADTLQDDHCVLRLPAGDEGLAERLRTDPACLRLRLRNGEAHVLLRGPAAALRERFQRQGLDFDDLRSASLEDLFVELVGERLVILVLLRKRPEVRYLGWLVLLTAAQALIGAWTLRSVTKHWNSVYEADLEGTHGVWLFMLAMTGLVGLRELGSRWEFFERSLPVEPQSVARGQLLAVLGATCLPPAVGMGLMCLLASGGLPRAMLWMCLFVLGGLGLFSTSLLAWQRPGVRFPLRGIVQGVLLVAGTILVARYVSGWSAGLVSAGLAGAMTAFLWRKEEVALGGLRRGSFAGESLRQRLATPGLFVVIAFWTYGVDRIGDPFLPFLLFFQAALMRAELVRVRALGYLPLGRRTHAARAVLLPLLALLASLSLQYYWPIGGIELGNDEPRLELVHTGDLRGLELRPSSVLWKLHLGSEAPLVTRPDGSTFHQELVPVVPGLFLRNPYEIGPGASEEFVLQRLAELGRALHGVELTPEVIERNLVQRGRRGLEPYGRAGGRLAQLFPDLPRVDFRNRTLGALALCVLLWALAVRSVLVLPSWPLLSRRSLLVRIGRVANLPARPTRFLLACAAVLIPVFVLTAFHEGLELASQVLLYQVGSLLARPAGALVAVVLVGLYAARAIRRVDGMDAVRLPLEAAAA